MNKHNIVEANAEIVAEGTRRLLESFDTYLAEAGPQTTADCFMILNNFHVMMVETIAKQWEPGVKKAHTYRMADMTFRMALRELRRKL